MFTIILTSIYIIAWWLASKYLLEENRVLGIWTLILWLVSTMMLIRIILLFYWIL